MLPIIMALETFPKNSGVLHSAPPLHPHRPLLSFWLFFFALVLFSLLDL